MAPEVPLSTELPVPEISPIKPEQLDIKKEAEPDTATEVKTETDDVKPDTATDAMDTSEVKKEPTGKFVYRSVYPNKCLLPVFL